MRNAIASAICAVLICASIAMCAGPVVDVSNHDGQPLGIFLKDKLTAVPPSPATITVTPTTAKQYEPIIAHLETEIPDGSFVFGDGWVCSDGMQTVAVGTTTQHIWACPGEHTIAYKGLWLLQSPKEVIVDIVDGKPVKERIMVTVGYGYVDASASFTVEGPDPNPQPGPSPGPLPPGSPLVLILWDSQTISGNQAAVKETIQEFCRSRPKLTFRTMEPDQPSENPWAAAAKQACQSFQEKSQNAGPVLMAGVLPGGMSGSDVVPGGLWSLPSNGVDAIALIKGVFPDE